MLEIKIYEAMDGTRFNSKYECENYEYELKQKELEKSDEYKRKKADIKRLKDMAIDFYGVPIHEHYLDPEYYFTWFKVNNDEEAALLEDYTDEFVNVSKYPAYVCVESEEEFFRDEEECDVGGQYVMLFDDCIKEAKWFFDEFGYDVAITKRSK